MSRIGNQPVLIPTTVTVTVADKKIIVKGPKGELMIDLPEKIKVEIKDQQVIVTRQNDEKESKALHGLIRSLINNMINGVTEGYQKTLKLVGTGYRVASKGQGISLSVGFSHQVDVNPLPGIQFKVESNNLIHIEGTDKQQVGQMAANIRAIRPPEPYKGKGIRYRDEIVRKKAGKAAVT